MSSVKHLNITVMGRVQGVCFRAYAKKEAERLGVRGFVRNEYDGTVYIEAEATGNVLEPFISWCGKGPPHARVEKMITKFSSLEDFSNFSIRY